MKISQLALATSLANEDFFPVVDIGVTKRATLNSLLEFIKISSPTHKLLTPSMEAKTAALTNSADFLITLQQDEVLPENGYRDFNLVIERATDAAFLQNFTSESKVITGGTPGSVIDAGDANFAILKNLTYTVTYYFRVRITPPAGSATYLSSDPSVSQIVPVTAQPLATYDVNNTSARATVSPNKRSFTGHPDGPYTSSAFTRTRSDRRYWEIKRTVIGGLTSDNYVGGGVSPPGTSMTGGGVPPGEAYADFAGTALVVLSFEYVPATSGNNGQIRIWADGVLKVDKSNQPFTEYLPFGLSNRGDTLQMNAGQDPFVYPNLAPNSPAFDSLSAPITITSFDPTNKDSHITLSEDNHKLTNSDPSAQYLATTVKGQSANTGKYWIEFEYSDTPNIDFVAGLIKDTDTRNVFNGRECAFVFTSDLSHEINYIGGSNPQVLSDSGFTLASNRVGMLLDTFQTGGFSGTIQIFRGSKCTTAQNFMGGAGFSKIYASCSAGFPASAKIVPTSYKPAGVADWFTP